jgi:hypothetical protein
MAIGTAVVASESMRKGIVVTKARVVLPGGARVEIEGSPEDVGALLALISSPEGAASPSPATKRAGTGGRTRPAASPGSRGPIGRVRELVAEGFFASKKGLGDVQRKLEEDAHIYPATSLSPALLRLVKGKELRRIKEGKGWNYVDP